MAAKKRSEDGLLILPILPLKNSVLFPRLMLPLSVGRANSIAAVQAAATQEEKMMVLVAQRDASVEDPKPEDLFFIGTSGVIRKMSRSDEGLNLLVAGTDRVQISDIQKVDGHLRGRVQILPLPADQSAELEALQKAVLEQGQKVIKLTQPQADLDVEQLYGDNRDPLALAYFFGSVLGLDVDKQQALLESQSRLDALRLVHEYLTHERKVLELRRKIAKQAEGEISKEQRDYVLRQQMRAIQDELGERNPEKAEVDVLRKRLSEADLPDDAKKEAERQLELLQRMSPNAPDFQMTRSHLELLLELPWRKSTTETIDLKRAREILDEDHYGVNDIKDRILEHLAVLKLNPSAHAPILCFVGPPGVGKTSLGQSIARAIGRKFERLSLGGMHDEAELRGHRRTYIGAMPGRIIQSIRRAGVNNPLLMLDEVDKLGRDFRGDPAAALLEILDPAQNSTFYDNYLNLQFDLSKVFFITTANTLETIPSPLLDRMEILPLSGYTQEEKLAIAKRYLIPRQITSAGLKPEELQIPDETLAIVIARYTREAGVRELERRIGHVTRKVARAFAEGKTDPVIVRPDDLSTLLGPERFLPERARKELPPGVSTGLAYTEAGGDVLYIEAALLPDGHGLKLTGQLGEVMRESAHAARSYLWSHAELLDIDRAQFKNTGVHIHVPAGAVPKDGPSAGVAMLTALTSLYRHIPVASDVAMTGEITLTGLVLPVGGIKEKVLAARRAGIRKVILPKDNAKDLRNIPEEARKDMEFFFVERVDEALRVSLPTLKPLVTLPI